MNKIIKLVLVTFIAITLFSCREKELPLPEVDESRGDLNIDKNINESTIDNYLNRSDVVYVDLRMLKDEATYENIGGDSYLSGFIKGFKVIPFPYICNVTGLPSEVGESYTGETLFSHDESGYYMNYKESFDLLTELFPNDKKIFLMCGGGGYANMMKELLVAFGYKSENIYNVGGYWYYEGNNKVEVKYEENGEIKYNFDLVDYYEFDFSSLTKVRNSYNKDDEVYYKNLTTQLNSLEDLNQLKEEVKTFILYIYLPDCSSCSNFLPIINDFIDGEDINIYSISYTELKDKEDEITSKVKYMPSVFIYKEGKVIAYLNNQNEDDKPYFNNLNNFSTWVNKYIDVDILKSDYEADTDCKDSSSCKL